MSLAVLLVLLARDLHMTVNPVRCHGGNNMLMFAPTKSRLTDEKMCSRLLETIDSELLTDQSHVAILRAIETELTRKQVTRDTNTKIM